MTVKVSHTADLQALFLEAAGLNNTLGNQRTKQIVLRLLQEMAQLIEELEISDDEFWTGVSYLNRLGAHNEVGLLAAGLGLEHFLDLFHNAKDVRAGRLGESPCTIEGPLQVDGSPLSYVYAYVDDSSEDHVAVPLFLEGQVTDLQGNPIAGALVDLWQANTFGNYSYFDKNQTDFNLRRQILTDSEGYYRVRSIGPSGYGCDPASPTQQCLDQLGRHGQRPAHIHFFVTASGYEHLTTQINLSNNSYLWDDLAYATHSGLIGEVPFAHDNKAAAHGTTGRIAEMNFDFQLRPAVTRSAEGPSNRS